MELWALILVCIPLLHGTDRQSLGLLASLKWTGSGIWPEMDWIRDLGWKIIGCNIRGATSRVMKTEKILHSAGTGPNLNL